MSYVYLKSQNDPDLWTVGFYKPNGIWEAESDHGIEEDAAQRAAWLNGGGSTINADLLAALKTLLAAWVQNDEAADKGEIAAMARAAIAKATQSR